MDLHTEKSDLPCHETDPSKPRNHPKHHSPPSDPVVVHPPRHPRRRTPPDAESPVTKSQLLKILDEAKKSPCAQMKCLQTVRSIASENQTNKRVMESAGVAEFLAKLIVKKTFEAPIVKISEDLSDLRKICDEALSILCGLQLSETGLKALNNARIYRVVNDRNAIRELRVAGLCNHASKETLKILITVCPWGRNRIKAVESGAVPIIIDLLLDSSEKRVCEMMLMLLDMLCQCAEGRAELVKHAAGLAVVSKKILRVSQVASEKAVRILHSISRFSATPGILQEMLQIGVVAKLCLMVQVDCGSKAKERAKEILKLHSRAWRKSSCIPRNLISSHPS
ncbi:hypothetical protein DH2020_014898 [Rehmannia glutinosa]|uniref:U-box domain-containing protein n=1 Tax=Rehmannia glutinosa TaxID=99300 RepID=A0ABR0WXS9_REHGL